MQCVISDGRRDRDQHADVSMRRLVSNASLDLPVLISLAIACGRQYNKTIRVPDEQAASYSSDVGGEQLLTQLILRGAEVQRDYTSLQRTIT